MINFAVAAVVGLIGFDYLFPSAKADLNDVLDLPKIEPEPIKTKTKKKKAVKND